MIKNTRNGKKYIGSTKNGRKREKMHFNELKKGIHHCDYLQNAWNAEEDKSVFQFSMFIYCKEDQLVALEQSCFDHMKPEYNSSLIAGRPEMTEAARKKISQKLTGRIGPWLGIKGPAHPSYGRHDNAGDKNPNYGKVGAMRGKKGPDHPSYGKPGGMKGRKGKDHPAFGKTGAWKGISGEGHPVAKLTQAQADEIRELSVNKLMKQKDIAAKYGISIWLVQQIKYNRSYCKNFEPN